jgi:hypothetical protein
MNRKTTSILVKYSEAEAGSYSPYSHVNHKLFHACKEGKPFWLMNDDFLVIDTWDLSQIQYWVEPNFKGIYEGEKPKGSLQYQEVMKRTALLFQGAGEMPSFVTHTPFWVGRPEVGRNLGLIAGSGEEAKNISFRQAYASEAFKMGTDGANIEVIEQDVKFRSSVDCDSDYQKLKAKQGSCPAVSMGKY